jgi:hypothetical protein
MVWLIICLLGFTILACFALMWVAAKTNDGLVSDHYYEEGQAIGKEFKRDDLARSLGLGAQVMLGEDGRSVHMLLLPVTQQPVAVQLRFAHPTKAGLDQVLTLRRDGGGMYAATLPEKLAEHRWLVQLEADGWRLQTEGVIGAGDALSMKPLQH